MVENAEPLGLGPVLRVDTSNVVDVASVVEWCHAHAWQGRGKHWPSLAGPTQNQVAFRDRRR